MTIHAVKEFANGTKAYLRASESGRKSLLSIVDKDGCLVAQRETYNKVENNGRRILDKVSIRANKDGKSSIEHLKIYSGKNTDFEARRSYFAGDSVYRNINIKTNPPYDIWYAPKKDISSVSCLDQISLDFDALPLLKASRHPKSKFYECEERIEKMFKQWFGKRTVKETPKPINPEIYA